MEAPQDVRRSIYLARLRNVESDHRAATGGKGATLSHEEASGPCQLHRVKNELEVNGCDAARPNTATTSKRGVVSARFVLSRGRADSHDSIEYLF